MKKSTIISLIGVLVVTAIGGGYYYYYQKDDVTPVYEKDETIYVDAYHYGEVNMEDYYKVTDGRKVKDAFFVFDNNLFNKPQDVQIVVVTDKKTETLDATLFLKDDVAPTIAVKDKTIEFPDVITAKNVLDYFDIYDMDQDTKVELRYEGKKNIDSIGFGGFMLSGNGEGDTEYVELKDDHITALTITAWDGHGNATAVTFKFKGQSLIETGFY